LKKLIYQASNTRGVEVRTSTWYRSQN